MPYRAPELFDVKTDRILDEKVDIWVGKDRYVKLMTVIGVYSFRRCPRTFAF